MSNKIYDLNLEVVDLKSMTDDIRQWFSKLQYLEAEDLRSIIKIMDKHLQSINEKRGIKSAQKSSFRSLVGGDLWEENIKSESNRIILSDSKC